MIRVASFRVHQHDPLGFLIQAETRGPYTHSALEIDRGTRTIIEAYYPTVRQRVLDPAEVSGIDFFQIRGLTDAQEQQILAFARHAIEVHEAYSISDLFRFNPFFRLFLGETNDVSKSAFCSMFAKLAIESSGLVLLNAHAYEVDPYRLTWSPLLEKDVP